MQTQELRTPKKVDPLRDQLCIMQSVHEQYEGFKLFEIDSFTYLHETKYEIVLVVT